jgi:hypothetical protein
LFLISHPERTQDSCGGIMYQLTGSRHPGAGNEREVHLRPFPTHHGLPTMRNTAEPLPRTILPPPAPRAPNKSEQNRRVRAEATGPRARCARPIALRRNEAATSSSSGAATGSVETTRRAVGHGPSCPRPGTRPALLFRRKRPCFSGKADGRIRSLAFGLLRAGQKSGQCSTGTHTEVEDISLLRQYADARL